MARKKLLLFFSICNGHNSPHLEPGKKYQTAGCVSHFAILNSSGATEGPFFFFFLNYCCSVTVHKGNARCSSHTSSMLMEAMLIESVLVKDEWENKIHTHSL